MAAYTNHQADVATNNGQDVACAGRACRQIVRLITIITIITIIIIQSSLGRRTSQVALCAMVSESESPDETR